MNTSLAPAAVPISPTPYTREQIDLIKRQVAVGVTDDELRLFLYQCQRTGLDALTRQIYAIKRRSRRADGSYEERMSIQTSIDGFRLIAQRSGEYRGQVGPFWCGAAGVWTDVWLSNEPPVASKVGVWRKDFTEPVWGVARTDAYASRNERGFTGLWRNMADTMIAKCAEALALRKAFPHELSGIYSGDEVQEAVDHDTGEIVPARPSLKPPPPKKQLDYDGVKKPKPQPDAPQMVTAKVLGIVQRPMTDGRVKFIISLDDGKTYQSLQLEHAEAAKEAQEASVPITVLFSATAEGRMIASIAEVEPEPPV
jgi:phage recombination protein Bet